jgi:tetratricopeptide (TPR) repeat protein
VLAALFVVAGYASVIWLIHQGVVQRSEYQFAPWFFGGAMLLVFFQLVTNPRGAAAREKWVGGVMFLLGAGSLAAAQLAVVEWPEIVAVMSMLFGLMLGAAGRRVLPAWFVLWLVIPLEPEIQQLTSSGLLEGIAGAASIVLDTVGYRHVREGASIELIQNQLLVADYCRGFRLLLPLVAFTALFAACRRPMICAVPLVISALFWGFIGELTLYTALLVATQLPEMVVRDDIITAGPLVFAILMTLCTDRLLRFLFAPVSLDDISPTPDNQSRLTGPWNWLTGGASVVVATPDPRPTLFHGGLGNLITQWRSSRSTLAMILGILPCVMFPAVVAFLGYGYQRTESENDWYIEAQQDALYAGDLAAAQLYWRRNRQQGQSDASIDLVLAKALYAADNRAFAQPILDKLAPEQGRGYSSAHFWLAQQIIQDHQGEVLPPEMRDRLIHHLEQTVKLSPRHREANSFLGKYYLQADNLQAAQDHLRRSAKGTVVDRLYLAHVAAKLGDGAAATEELKVARKELQLQLGLDPDEHDTRFALAEAERWLDNYQSSIDTLEEGLRRGAGEKFEKAIAKVHFAWLDYELKRQRRDPQKCFDLAIKALERGADHLATINRLAILATDPGDVGQEVTRMLQTMLTDSTTPVFVYMALGSTAFAKEDWEQAKEYLEHAYRMAPEQVAVVNNLAWALAFVDPPELERALELANEAAKLSPHPGTGSDETARRQAALRYAEVRGTRGIILSRLGRHRTALSDLEIALRTLHGRPMLHEALATTYEHFDFDDLAEQHRALAEKYQSAAQ